MLKLLYKCALICVPEKPADEFDPTYGDAKYSAEEGFGLCGQFLIVLSYLLLLLGMPFTLCCCLKVYK